MGKYFVGNSDEGRNVGKIVETEAYISPHDTASHAYRGLRTDHTVIQFSPGGFALIYLIYGM